MLEDIRIVETFAPDLSLQLNRIKCEVICPDFLTAKALLEEMPEMKILDPEDVVLLDTLVGGMEAVDSTIRSKIENLKLLGNRLQLPH